MQLKLFEPVPPPARTVFVRHRRARRFVMRVLADGTVRVTMPRWAAKRDAQAFVDASGEWIAEQRARHAELPERRPRRLRPFIEQWYKRRAEQLLSERLLTLARQHDVAVTRISIRDQRSRWGACSSRGTITLNWRLVLVPEFVRDYVLLHELMHRRELNHSRRFWRLVARCCPRHLEARRWLKTEGKRLWDHE